MLTLVKDLKYAVRLLRRSPGFAVTAIATLALGLGATAAMWGVIQAVLLAPLPYAQPDQLVGVAFTFPGERPNAEQAGATADFLRRNTNLFSSSAVLDDGSAQVNLSIPIGQASGGPVSAHAVNSTMVRVSEGYFRTLGAQPQLGRSFTAEEDRPGGARAVMLSDGLWTRAFGRDPGIVGRAIRVNEESYTVVGVMPAGFHAQAESAPGVLATPDLWQPLQLSPADPGYDGDNYEMIARLRPGVTITQVQQQLTTLEKPFYEQNPSYKAWTDGKRWNGFRVWPLQDVLVRDVRRSLMIGLAAVLTVLLVACLNLAGLMMARAMRRRREISLRSALGAGRTQLLRLLATEGLLLALAGGAIGLLVAHFAVAVLLHGSPLGIPTLQGGPSDGLLAGMVMAGALPSTCLFAVLPAWLVLRGSGSGNSLRLGGVGAGEQRSHAQVSRFLVIAQVAVAMALVSAASVLLGTFAKLQAMPAGIEPRQLSVFQVALKGDAYASTEKTTQFVDRVLHGLRSTPGVDHVAAVNGLPLDSGLNIGGNPSDRPNLRHIIEVRSVTPDYFATMGMRLFSGRGVASSDQANTDPVVVIGATAARKWWPGRSPIGESVRIGSERNWRIVGVVSDVPMHSLVDTGDIVLYVPMVQLSDKFTKMMNGWIVTSFAVRTAAHVDLARPVANAVAQADPEIPVLNLTTMQAVIDRTLSEPRFFSLLAGGFSGFALVLTVIGLFGLLSYQVSQRTREIGVRMALGADRPRILLGILGRGLTLAATGIAVGLALSWWMRPVVKHLIEDAGVDTSAGALPVMAGGAQMAVLAVLAILAAAVGASWLPARRAASVEPMEALRSE